MGNHQTEGLSPAEIRELHRISGLMIPADAAYGVPAANDPAIFDDIVASLGRDLPAIRTALSMLAEHHLGDLDDTAAETAIQAFLSTPEATAAALSRAVLQCYYRDERVLCALGLDPRPPYPRGHAVEQGDWSLLDPVRGLAPFWRDDRRS